MIRSVIVAVPLALLLAAYVAAEEVSADAQEVARGGKGGHKGWSQQYHYQHHPVQEGHTYAGLSFDLSSGLVLMVGSLLVLYFFAAVCWPLLGKGGDGYGYGGGAGTQYASYRNIDLAGISEKALAGIEKLYEMYNKKQ